MNRLKNNFLIILVLLISFSFQLILSFYGKPFVYHPDEIAILKRPLKLIYLYLNSDFSQTSSLYMWIQNIWFGVCYIIGIIFGFWGDFDSFKNAVIIEKWEVIHLFRILSITLTTIGNFFLIKTLSKFNFKRKTLLIFALIIVLNPIVILNTFWIKYEALSFLIFSILIYSTFNYFVHNKKNNFNLYIIIFIAITTRVELFIYVGFIILYDVLRMHNGIKDYIIKNWIKFIIGFGIYSVITLRPISLIFNLFYASSSDVGKFNNYSKVISEDLLNIMPVEYYLNALTYYSALILIAFPPMIIYLIKYYRKLNVLNFLTIPTIFFFIILVFHSKHIGSHYIVLVSVFFMIYYCYISSIKQSKTTSIFALATLLYLLSLNIELISFIKNRPDNLRLASNYINNNVASKSTILVEDFGNPGFSPPLYECNSFLKMKYEAIILKGGGTGQTAKQKSKQIEPKVCYKIVDMFSEDYFKDTDLENKFVHLKSNFNSSINLNYFDAIVLNNMNNRFWINNISDFQKKEFKTSKHFDFRINYILKNSHLKSKEVIVFLNN